MTKPHITFPYTCKVPLRTIPPNDHDAVIHDIYAKMRQADHVRLLARLHRCQQIQAAGLVAELDAQLVFDTHKAAAALKRAEALIAQYGHMVTE